MDEFDEIFEKSLGRMAGILFSIAVGTVICILLGSCVTKYVPVETVKTEYVTNTVHDSTYIDRVERDSFYIEKAGDTITIYKTRYVYQDRWRERIVTDTLIKVDSIQVPFPVEKKVPFWEKAKLCSLGAVGTAVLVGAVVLAWWIRRRYKRC